MTNFVDFEKAGPDGSAALANLDIIIVGCGAAGITIARELGKRGISIAVIESGGLEEDAEHELLNAVEATGRLAATDVQLARAEHHANQLKFWDCATQQFGVRCRVLGGSTAGWAGKVAPFDGMDFERRDWIANSGWPISAAEISTCLDRAADHLNLGPVVSDRSFWTTAGIREPEPVARLKSFTSFFWQFARSRHNLTDVMRFGPDFRRESHRNLTVLYNATAVEIMAEDTRVRGIRLRSSLTGRHGATLSARTIVLAAGAIENARLLLASKDGAGAGLGNALDVVGRYLTDHPSVALGMFESAKQERAAKLLGFFALQKDFRVFMYSHGLALRPEAQRELKIPNLAVFAAMKVSRDDPLRAFARLFTRTSEHVIADVASVIANAGLVVTSVGRKLVTYPKIPLRLRRLITEAAIKLNPNFVAGDYQSRGRGRKLESVSLNVICEQPPSPENRIVLSDRTDRLGLPLARVTWNIEKTLREDLVRFARLLRDELSAVGVEGFDLHPSFENGDAAPVPIYDMAHTAGTTRMGTDPATSVVDADCRVHGIEGLYVSGASVFPTSGHANPTLMIVALAIRLADHLKQRLANTRLQALAPPDASHGNRPLVLVTGATGNLGGEVLAKLAAQDYRIRATYRNRLPNAAGVEWVKFDFADPAVGKRSFDELVRGAVGVVNLSASLSDVAEMDVANVANLERLAAACRGAGVRYFFQASSMAVYGSPREKLVTEDTPVLDLGKPLGKQYFAEPYMREYARTKLEGEQVLARFGGGMRVDIGRIAVAQPVSFLDESLHWGRMRSWFSLYRNSHFMASGEVARAIVHLLTRSLADGSRGVEVYNVGDENSPTYADHLRASGMRPGFHIPVVLDVLKGVKIGRTLAFRYPMGWFRMSNAKLRATGFGFGTGVDAR
jgi:choline dehydrogenase-like flavoprotein/nucleoside-diphosphate-sugar epimerase